MKLSLKLTISGALLLCIILVSVWGSPANSYRNNLHVPMAVSGNKQNTYPLNFTAPQFTNQNLAVAAPAATKTSKSGNWSDPNTWFPVGVPVAGDDVIIADATTVTIDVNTETLGTLTIGQTVTGSAILQFEGTTARTITVNGDVTVNPTSIFRSAEASSTSEIKTHSLVVGGSLINKGTIDFSAKAGLGGTTLNATGAGITFNGIGDAQFNCLEATSTNLKQTNGVNLNKGTSPSPILTFIPGGLFNVLSANSVGFLNIISGTFKVGGTGSFSNPIFNDNGSYEIPLIGGFWLENPSANVIAMDGSLVNKGELKITAGTFNVGNSSGNSSVTSSDGKFTLSGGTMNIAGRFKISGGECTIEGGTLNIATVGHSAIDEAAFHITITAHLLIKNDPLITYTQANTNATPFSDIEIVGTSNKSIIGGTFQIGTTTTASASSIFIINSAISFYNLVINNDSNNSPSVKLTGNNLTVSNKLTMNGGNIDASTNSKKVILTNPDIASLERTRGFVIGEISRAISSTGGLAYVFPVGNDANYTPLSLDFTGANNGGNITVSSIAGADFTGSLLNSTNSVNNHWDITNNGVTYTNMGGDFSFPEAIPPGGPYKLGIYNGLSWTYPTVTLATTTSLRFSGVSTIDGSITFALAACTTPTINGTLNVCISSTTQLSGSGTPASVPWSSSNTSVATITNGGLVAGIAAGTSVITYTELAGCLQTVTITVNALPTASSSNLNNS